MEFFQRSSPYYHANNQRFTSEKTDHFIVDDLLDFPTDDLATEDSSAAVDSCNSSSHCGTAEPSLAGDDGCRSFVDNQFSNLCTPYDDLAEFEWLSNFVEESYSNEDVQKHQLLSGVEARPEQPEIYPFKSRSSMNRTNNSLFNYDMTIPGKARTKRSRVTSHNWASRLPVMGSTNSRPDIVSNNSTEPKKINIQPKNEEGRKCLHCDTNTTPQWRTGPMGPRTLCNACGVRYKSGRLVPEYRPAASPTFVLTKHSNSHRKVLELRRQKMQKTMHHQQPFVNHQDVMLQMPNANNYYFIPHP
ncbi:putative transcription factor C2C2-GATA family [Helianthus anomalus]